MKLRFKDRVLKIYPGRVAIENALTGRNEKGMKFDDLQAIVHIGGLGRYIGLFDDKSKATKVFALPKIRFEYSKEDEDTAREIVDYLDSKLHEPASSDRSKVELTPPSFQNAWVLRYGEAGMQAEFPGVLNGEVFVDVVCYPKGIPTLVLTSKHLHSIAYDSKGQVLNVRTQLLSELGAVHLKDDGGRDVKIVSKLKESAAAAKTTGYGSMPDFLSGRLEGPHGLAEWQHGATFVAAVTRQMLATGSSTPALVPSASLADEISKLKNLLDSGVLSEDEFNQAKVRLLSGPNT